MASYTIIHGNCLKELKYIDANSIDLIFADPPYWMRTTGVLKRIEGTDYSGCRDDWDNQFTTLDDYAAFTTAWLKECYRVLSPNGSLWVIGGMQCIYTIGNALQETGYWIINDVIWHKTNPTPHFKGTLLNNSHETLIWAVKSQKSKYTFHYKTAKELNTDTVIASDYKNGIRKQMGSVWRFSVCSGNERIKDNEGHKLHSAQKPYALLYRIITLCSSIGDTVLDPFAGTCTTGAVAKQCGRNFIGIDVSKEYCAYGKRRLEATEEKIGNIEKATFDIKPIKVRFKDLLDKHYLQPNEKLFLKGTPFFSILQADGTVLLPDHNIITDIHTAAALLNNKKASRLNGFEYWYIERNNSLISLNKIREAYREAIKNTVTDPS